MILVARPGGRVWESVFSNAFRVATLGLSGCFCGPFGGDCRTRVLRWALEGFLFDF